MANDESNYFTVVEDHFRAARRTSLFMLSPMDWSLLEAWKNAGVPLGAALRGIDVAFERFRKRPAQARTQMVNSLAYCAQAIMAEAQAMANATPIAGAAGKAPFSFQAVQDFISRNAGVLRGAGHSDLAESLESLDLNTLFSNLEQLEKRLTAIEEELIARLRAHASEEALTEARRALERELKPYRGRMTADQLAMLEKQFLERKLLESAGLPRLSLFYL